MAYDPKNTECVECGSLFEGKRKDAAYCSADCRITFNQRRSLRGQVLYDLMMVNRHERKLAKTMKVWFLITRLCMYWREQDHEERNGRRSWRDAKRVIQANAWAKATVADRR